MGYARLSDSLSHLDAGTLQGNIYETSLRSAAENYTEARLRGIPDRSLGLFRHMLTDTARAYLHGDVRGFKGDVRQ